MRFWVLLSAISLASTVPVAAAGLTVALEYPLPIVLRNALAAALAITSIVIILLRGEAQAPLRAIEEATERVRAGDLQTTIAERSTGNINPSLLSFDAMTRELRSARRRVAKAERAEAWRHIAQRIAHEIKNPLSPIQMAIETLRKTRASKHPDFDEIFDESTVAILEEVARLRQLVEEFSSFARLPKPRVQEMDLRSVATHVAALVDDEGIEITVEGPPAPLVADRDQLVQVALNLVQNAIEAVRGEPDGDGHGRIRIGIEPGAEHVALVVEDSGPGIAPEDRDRVFDPYVTGKARGTGLGLAISLRIVEEHGGSLEVTESALGGARFEATIPSLESIRADPSEAVPTV
ncbi:MAG: hypothetical protein KC416_02170 [Myxococcales bacterium]|nr:hypothetical protein [Myxococcales bacterium]